MPREPVSSARNVAALWADAHRYSPAPRHRRRIILKMLSGLRYSSCLDAGCAQPFLLAELCRLGKRCYGCDISERVIADNRRMLAQAEFSVVDIAAEVYPGGACFDLVVSSEVLEHIDDWAAAVKHLCLMSRNYVLLSVPGGRLRSMDRLVGHVRHFAGSELVDELNRQGYRVDRYIRWGFPAHAFYKWMISYVPSRGVYESFGKGRYSVFKRCISQVLYRLFFINDLFPWGSQIFILATRAESV